MSSNNSGVNFRYHARISSYSPVTPITIEVEDDRAFVRYVEEEKVLDEEGVEEWTKFHFVATLIRTDGRFAVTGEQ